MPNSEQSRPSEQLMESFDFRVRSLRQLLSGDLRPGERRVRVFQKRRAALADDVFDSTKTQEHGQLESSPEQSGDGGAANTDDEDEPDEDSRHKPASVPSMATAAERKSNS